MQLNRRMIKDKSKDSYSKSSSIWLGIDDSLDYTFFNSATLGYFLSLSFLFFIPLLVELPSFL